MDTPPEEKSAIVFHEPLSVIGECAFPVGIKCHCIRHHNNIRIAGQFPFKFQHCRRTLPGQDIICIKPHQVIHCPF